MSTHTHDDHGHDHDDHGHGHDHDEHGEGASHSTLGGYATGFILSVILTAIPFWLTIAHVITNVSTLGFVLLGIGAVQMVVHMIYFLHMNTKSEGGWNMLAMLFTIMLLVIVLSGSVWVMFHLNDNMMPGMMSGGAQQMHDMP